MPIEKSLRPSVPMVIPAYDYWPVSVYSTYNLNILSSKYKEFGDFV